MRRRRRVYRVLVRVGLCLMLPFAVVLLALLYLAYWLEWIDLDSPL